MIKIIFIFLLKLNSHHSYMFTSLVTDTEAESPCFVQLLQCLKDAETLSIQMNFKQVIA